MEYQTAEQLSALGFRPCNDGDLNARIAFLYKERSHVALMDKEGNAHLFMRHNDGEYYTHIRALMPMTKAMKFAS